MASNADFVQYMAERLRVGERSSGIQCNGACDITTKKMFGDYGIYCDGKIFGLICDGRFYVKPTKAGRALLKQEALMPPYEGAKDYFYVADVDDRDYLSALACETCKALPAPGSASDRHAGSRSFLQKEKNVKE